MLLLKRSFLIIVGLMVLLIVTGCGSTTNTSSNTTQNTPTAQSTPTSTPTTASATSAVTVKTATVTVAGKSMNILTDGQGKTLYYFTPDTSKSTACTGSCASTWPPLLFSGTGNPTASEKLPGELEIYPNANGKQVIYNDHPLYTYGGDSAAGQTNGQGIGGKWFVATPDLAKNK